MNAGGVTVRRARAGDAEVAATLWARLQDEMEALDARHRPSPSAHERWLNDFGVWVRSDVHRVFVAEQAGVLVGVLTAHTYWPSPMIEQEMEVYVVELVVAPEARGAGVGARLVEAARAWARDLGVARIRAAVLDANTRGRSFWKREGAQDFYTTVTLPVTRPGDSTSDARS